MCLPTGSKPKIIEVSGEVLVILDGMGQRAITFHTTITPGTDDCDKATAAVLNGTDVFSIAGVTADLANRYNEQDGRFSSDLTKVDGLAKHIETSIKNGAALSQVRF